MTNTLAIVIAALALVETGGHPNPAEAVGDSGRAVGVYQMWPIAVREANRLEGIEARREGRTARVWTYADRTCPEASREMAAVTLRWHYRRGVTCPVELGGRWRNPSSHNPAPDWYLERIRQAIEKQTGGTK